MKKMLVPILIVLAALLVLGGTLIYLFVRVPKLVRGAELTQPSTAVLDEVGASLQDYVTAQFPDYQVVSYDGDAAVLTLEYPLSVPYAQLQKHGVAAGYAELAEDTLFNAGLLRDGCQISCGVTVSEVVICAVSSDGQEAYRVSTRTGVTACWDEP